MVVEGRSVDWERISKRDSQWIDRASPDVTTGEQYVVGGLAIFEGAVLVLIIDDANLVAWKPAVMFNVVDATLPDDWMVSLFRGEPTLVLGPSIVAATPET